MEKSIFSDTNAICVAGNVIEILEIVCKNWFGNFYLYVKKLGFNYSNKKFVFFKFIFPPSVPLI